MDFVQQIEQNGLAIVERVAPGPVIESLLQGISAHPDRPAAIARRGSVFARRNLLDCEAVREFAEGDRARALVEPVLGPAAMPVRAILFDKTREANWTVPWHQDRSIAVRAQRDVAGFGPWSTKAGVVHVQPPLEVLCAMLTLRLHLDDCGPDAGPLRAIAGTHQRIMSAAEVDQAVASGEQRSCVVARGDVVLMRPLVLHASSPARRADHRRVLHIEYAAAPLPAGLSWHFRRHAPDS